MSTISKNALRKVRRSAERLLLAQAKGVAALNKLSEGIEERLAAREHRVRLANLKKAMLANLAEIKAATPAAKIISKPAWASTAEAIVKTSKRVVAGAMTRVERHMVVDKATKLLKQVVKDLNKKLTMAKANLQAEIKAHEGGYGKKRHVNNSRFFSAQWVEIERLSGLLGAAYRQGLRMALTVVALA